MRDFAAGRLAGDRVLRKVRRRVASSGAGRRLTEVAGLPACPPAAALLLGLEAFACWDGGYVRGFLEEVRSIPGSSG